MDRPTSANRPVTQGPDMPGTGMSPPDTRGAAEGDSFAEAEAQAVPLAEQEEEGGITPGGGNTPGGALNTGPDAGGRGMGSTG